VCFFFFEITNIIIKIIIDFHCLSLFSLSFSFAFSLSLFLSFSLSFSFILFLSLFSFLRSLLLYFFSLTSGFSLFILLSQSFSSLLFLISPSRFFFQLRSLIFVLKFHLYRILTHLHQKRWWERKKRESERNICWIRNWMLKMKEEFFQDFFQELFIGLIPL
jgi:hypothetical protein